MPFEYEDEVDWSDGSLGSPTPASATCIPESPPHLALEQAEYEAAPLESEEYQPVGIPPGEPVPLDHVGTHYPTRFGISRAQRSKIGLHFNRREPTKNDYSNIALYQANQKTYEAIFLKTFVAHALHPDQFRACYSDSDPERKIEWYLQSVSNNVNQIVTRMIWNAHSRTVNLLANDGKDGAHFLDWQRFEKELFSDFYPNNVFPVVEKMSESWHRAFTTPSMVRYTTKDYPIGKHCSPFEEIDEVAGTLFKGMTTNKKLATGRVVKPPSMKRDKSRNLPGAAVRDAHNIRRGNWLHGIVPTAIANVNHHIPTNDTTTPPATERATNANKYHVDWNQFTEEVESYAREHDVPNPESDSGFTPMEIGPASSTSQSVSIGPSMSSVGTGMTELEKLVHQHGPDALMRKALSVSDEEESMNHSAVHTGRLTLIKNHEEQLAARRFHSPRQTRSSTPGVIAAIDDAIARGILLPPTPEVQALIDTAARIERKRLAQSADVQQKVLAARSSKRPKTQLIPHRMPSSLRSEGQLKRIKPGRDSAVTPKKRQKKMPSASDASNMERGSKQCSTITASVSSTPLSPHPSGSRTLEPDQVLPPTAYFERTAGDETPAWRCGIKHAMGHYYNAGDRRNCTGCFTSVNENPKLRWMDFYLPSRSYYYQPAPGIIWKPSKATGKVRRSKTLSHNSIAKEAYWEAINIGSTGTEARRKGVEAVLQHLQPKPRRDPTPEPTPEPVDLGPHPSGSTTMEHGQDLPEIAYFAKKERHEELAWRCDSGHALGRYYLAGDKKTCPGCGSSKTGLAPHTTMDFYMPAGAVVRQEAPGLATWRPRRPNKMARPRKSKNKAPLTHNQFCAKTYWEAFDAGRNHEDAIEFALKATDAWIDAKNEEIQNNVAEFESGQHSESQGGHPHMDVVSSSSRAERTDANEENLRRNSEGGVIISIIPQKRGSEELSDNEHDEVEEYETGRDDETEGPKVIVISSDDESTSGSDSE